MAVLSSSRVALDRAAVLLTMKREMVRLDNVWGVGGGLRPVKHLIKEVCLHQNCKLISPLIPDSVGFNASIRNSVLLSSECLY